MLTFEEKCQKMLLSLRNKNYVIFVNIIFIIQIKKSLKIKPSKNVCCFLLFEIENNCDTNYSCRLY
ncbi:hypothetical protein BpHYR1_014484 [Brachionus plicatilis]|uniref:Uncharacterized protein n=1 Tax=Brachionus plicatilis TaxID=10195 RepID=A0A3M7RA57_BRAPC|nr:hypothetical protein BpHYR1_014484 [Brachionus plicatilis]